jgi:plastocyanin
MKSTAKILASAAIIALLGAGCAIWPSSNANVPAAGTSSGRVASGTMTIRLLPDGEFEPITAFVKKGTVVTFNNTTHGLHSIIPVEDSGKKFAGLDSKGTIAAGGKFSVTMNQAGRWYFADGTNTAFSGAIEVTE